MYWTVFWFYFKTYIVYSMCCRESADIGNGWWRWILIYDSCLFNNECLKWYLSSTLLALDSRQFPSSIPFEIYHIIFVCTPEAKFCAWYYNNMEGQMTKIVYERTQKRRFYFEQINKPMNHLFVLLVIAYKCIVFLHATYQQNGLSPLVPSISRL